jgi:hypothetical protein
MRNLSASILLALATLSAAGEAAADPGYRVVWDDFRTPWSTDTRWLPFVYGAYDADDGCGESTSLGLRIHACGANAVTGDPAFRNTLGQSAGALAAFDHAKWIVIMNHLSSAGLPGFDAVPGQELACEAVVSGEVFGAKAQPFGDAVTDPEADPRLGAVAISAFDAETFVIFNFLLTNSMVYAFYERPAFARLPGADDAAFQFVIPVATRRPSDRHRLAIAYDRAAGTARWILDGVEVFRVDAIGSRIDRRYMLLDHGGYDVALSPAQMDCGMAMFDFLDGYGPTGRGLVQLEANDGDAYDDPRVGPARGLGFVDPESRLSSRLFGQGAAMTVERFVVSSDPAGDGRELCVDP